MSDFYTRLKNGESAEDIVAQMTAELNEAEKRVAEEAKAEAKRKQEEAQRADLRAKGKDALASLIRDFGNWCGFYYPSLGITGSDMEDEELNALAELVMMLFDTENIKAKFSAPKTFTKTSPKIAVKTNFGKIEEDAFAKFFEELGI